MFAIRPSTRGSLLEDEQIECVVENATFTDDPRSSIAGNGSRIKEFFITVDDEMHAFTTLWFLSEIVDDRIFTSILTNEKIYTFHWATSRLFTEG